MPNDGTWAESKRFFLYTVASVACASAFTGSGCETDPGNCHLSEELCG